MRLLHISDLHAGRTLFKVSRNEDLIYSLEQVESFCKDSRPDLVLIAGDVFDKANPDNDSKEIIFNFLLKLRELTSAVVLISGNHDSYDFMRSVSSILKLANVHVYDRPNKENFLFSMGELKVACLPYPSERVISPADEESKKTYTEKVRAFLLYMAEAVRGAKYKVLLSHLFVAGSKYTTTEREASISRHYAVEPAHIPEVFDYVALGHVHRHQRIKGVGTQAYYTGSMFQLDFSEEGDRKFFNLIELEEGKPAKVTPVELSLKNHLHAEVIEQKDIKDIIDRLKRTGGLIKLLINVKDKSTLGNLSDRLKEELGDKLVRIEFRFFDKQISDAEKLIGRKIDLTELYEKFYKREHNTRLPEEVSKTFSRLLHEVEEQS